MINADKDVLLREYGDEVCDLVLCKWHNQFVVWTYNKTTTGDGCGHGDYFLPTIQGLKDAIDKFEERLDRMKR
jgi:hypothetical protein